MHCYNCIYEVKHNGKQASLIYHYYLIIDNLLVLLKSDFYVYDCRCIMGVLKKVRDYGAE
jgi:hypothetical protein